MMIHLKEAATRTDRASQNREQELKDAEEQELKVALSEPTTTVPVAGAILGLSKNKAYAAAARGEIPTLRFGRRLVVPTMLLKRMLGMEALAGNHRAFAGDRAAISAILQASATHSDAWYRLRKKPSSPVPGFSYAYYFCQCGMYRRGGR